MTEFSEKKNKEWWYKAIKTTCEETKITLKGCNKWQLPTNSQSSWIYRWFGVAWPFWSIHHGVWIKVWKSLIKFDALREGTFVFFFSFANYFLWFICIIKNLQKLFLGAPTVHTYVTKTHQNLPNSAANKYSSASHHGQKNKKNIGQIKFWVVTIKI